VSEQSTTEPRVVIVTGGSRGLGAGIVRSYLDSGDVVATCARSITPEVEAWMSDPATADRFLWASADLAKVEDADAFVKAVVAKFGRIDVLINNASELGPSPMPPLEEHPWQSLLRIYRVNVVAPLHLIQLLLPGMKERRRGTILNITSDAGLNAYKTWGGYGSSKAALEHASRVLAAELEGSGVRVLVVDPGDMNTEMHRLAEPGVDLSHLPVADDVAPSIVDLLDTKEPFARVEAQRLEPFHA
jgi:3-oxoacyl-[acyl-carrier protein] reductase